MSRRYNLFSKLDTAAGVLFPGVCFLCHDGGPDFPDKHDLGVDEKASDDHPTDNADGNVDSVTSVLMSSFGSIRRSHNPANRHVDDIEDHRAPLESNGTKNGSAGESQGNELNNDDANNVLLDSIIFCLDICITAVTCGCRKGKNGDNVDDREHDEQNVHYDGCTTHVATAAAAFLALLDVGVRLIVLFDIHDCCGGCVVVCVDISSRSKLFPIVVVASV